MTTKTKLLTSIALSALSLAGPLSALAAEHDTPAAAEDAKIDIVPQDTLGQIPSLIQIIRAIIQFILVVAFVLAFIFLLIGGIRWITAGGDEKAVSGARGTITAALVGLVIVLVAYALIRLVETFFGVNIITGGVRFPTVQNTDIN